MSGDFTTHLDKPYAQQPATRAAATRFLERTGNADVMAALGLVDEPEPLAIDGHACCPVCEQPLPGDGRRSCRRSTCPAGPTSRREAS